MKKKPDGQIFKLLFDEFNICLENKKPPDFAPKIRASGGGWSIL